MNRMIALACVSLLGLGAVASAPLAAQAQVVASTPRMVNLPRGTSFAVDLPADARDVIVSNPRVAEAMLHSPRRITVIGLAGGEHRMEPLPLAALAELDEDPGGIPALDFERALAGHLFPLCEDCAQRV
jgi:hypothetical protein